MITYVDAGVLIAIARGTGDIAERALAVVDDPGRALASSVFVQLEVLPKAAHGKRLAEVALYDAYFEAVQHWPTSVDDLPTKALELARAHGLSALDALHVAAAISVGADELVTTERRGRPIHRVAELRVVSIHE